MEKFFAEHLWGKPKEQIEHSGSVDLVHVLMERLAIAKERARDNASSPASLEEAIAEFMTDPLGFVNAVFPWGEGELVGESGPDTWQAGVLSDIGQQCLTLDHALQYAVASGHGVGKTALIAWIILWFMSTRPHPQIVVTANTKSQLQTKTWRELSRWHKRAINAHWFDWQATSFKYKAHPETWTANAIPWSANNSEAFAGTHEAHVLVIYDEASAIDDVIWEVTEGAMTTPGAMWIAFGNPTLIPDASKRASLGEVCASVEHAPGRFPRGQNGEPNPDCAMARGLWRR